MAYEEIRDTYFGGVEGAYSSAGNTINYDWFASDDEWATVFIILEEADGEIIIEIGSYLPED